MFLDVKMPTMVVPATGLIPLCMALLHWCVPEHGLHGNRVDGDHGVEIHPSKAQAGGKGYLSTLQSLLQQVPSVIVQGIPTVERAVVEKLVKDEKSVLSFTLMLHVLLYTQPVDLTWKYRAFPLHLSSVLLYKVLL